MGVSELLRAAEPAEETRYSVRIRLFGLLELENQFGMVKENTARSSLSWSLLKYLLLNPEAEISREEILRDLWPDDEKDAASVLRIRLHRLREALAPLQLDGKNGLVLFRGKAYSLNPRYTLWTDAEAFLELMEQIRTSAPDDPAALELCVQALELFRGPFMAYTEKAPWVTRYRDYYHKELCVLARNTLTRMSALGDDRALDLLCRRAAAIVPEEGALHQHIIKYMIRHKRQAELVRYISFLSQYSGPEFDWLEQS